MRCGGKVLQIKARNDERRERNHAVAKRNKEACHIR